MIKLVALDLDGTLLGPGYKISIYIICFTMVAYARRCNYGNKTIPFQRQDQCSINALNLSHQSDIDNFRRCIFCLFSA